MLFILVLFSSQNNIENKVLKKNIHFDKVESKVEIINDSSMHGMDILCVITNKTFHWKNYYDFVSNGSGNGISFIIETNKQKMRENFYSDDGTITLEVSSPNTYPIDTNWDFNKKNWTKTYFANEIEYDRNFINLISRVNNEMPKVNKLIEYYSGNECIEYSSNLIGIEDPNEKFYEFKLIGYLERPNFTKNESNNLFGQLTIYSPHTNSKKILKIYNELDLNEEFNFYKNYHFDRIELVGRFNEKEKAREINEIEIIDNKYNGNIENYKIRILFDGIKKETIVIPVINSEIIVDKIDNKNFTYEYIGK